MTGKGFKVSRVIVLIHSSFRVKVYYEYYLITKVRVKVVNKISEGKDFILI